MEQCDIEKKDRDTTERKGTKYKEKESKKIKHD